MFALSTTKCSVFETGCQTDKGLLSSRPGNAGVETGLRRSEGEQTARRTEPQRERDSSNGFCSPQMYLRSEVVSGLFVARVFHKTANAFFEVAFRAAVAVFVVVLAAIIDAFTARLSRPADVSQMPYGYMRKAWLR